jgi:hypothetical protein
VVEQWENARNCRLFKQFEHFGRERNTVLPMSYSALREPRRNFLHIARGRKAHPGILWGEWVPEGSKAPTCVGNITIGKARSPAGLLAQTRRFDRS